MVNGVVTSPTHEVVGVLALQGDYERHRRAFAALGASVRDVRTARDLEGVTRLVIPGGESTTLTILLTPALREAVTHFCRQRPVWGTCAGMIMLGKGIGDPRVRPFEVMDLAVERNGYGRQVHSFEADVSVAEELGDSDRSFHAIFIRAPRAIDWGAAVRPLAWLNQDPVCLRDGHILASAFHPELTDDRRFHRYFLSMTA